MRNFLSSERHKCLHLDDRVVKKVSKTNFGGITNKAICWGISAMLSISPMVGIWGAPHAPKSDATAIRENARAPIRKTQAIWGANPKPPISPMACIWELPKPQGVYGECPMPPSQTLPLFGRMPEPQSGRRKLFGSPQAPYLRWRVFGRMPKPRGVYGENPIPPKTGRCRYSGEARTPIRKTQAVWEFPSPISPMACIWELPKPQGVYGEYPMPPRQDAAAIRENARTPIFIFHFSLFNFHFLLHSP